MNNLASPWRRLIAFAIDGLVWLMYTVMVLSWFSAAGDIPTVLGRILLVFIGYFLFFSLVYHFINILLLSVTGGTIGMLLTGLATVRPDGKHLTLARAFLRNYIGYMVSGLYLLGFIWVFIDKEHRGWHDQLADTYVVVVRKPGWVTGLAALIVVGLLSFYYGSAVVNNYSYHKNMYTQFAVTMYEELKPTPTPTGMPTPTFAPARLATPVPARTVLPR